MHKTDWTVFEILVRLFHITAVLAIVTAVFGAGYFVTYFISRLL